MWKRVVSRIRRLRPSVFIVGVAVVASGLGAVLVQQLTQVRDGRVIAEVAKGCGVLPDASVARWFPGARAQREPIEADEELRCRWRAADPRAHNAAVELTVHLFRRTAPEPLEDNPRELTAVEAYNSLLYRTDDGPLNGPGVDIESPLIGDEAVSVLQHPPEQGAEEVTAMVQFRRANAVVRLRYHDYGVPDGTARGVAEAFAREVVSRL